MAKKKSPAEKPRRKTRSESGRLIVVANRLPVHRVRQGGKSVWKMSPGGLVTALEPILQDTGGAWVGWAGSTGAAPKPFKSDRIDLKPVPLSKQELDSFYAGFSNATLWPLYHDAIRVPVFRRSWWAAYEKVNRRFAEAAAAVYKPGDTVWVHDYQLQLVPGMLRELRPDAKIGFFLHIPFCSEELFARIPRRKEILEGMLGADLLGFQTRLSGQNFARTARRFTSATGKDTELHFGDRVCRVSNFPISIDFKRFEGMASSAEVLVKAEKIRQKLGPERRILLGVDRLDYTKGIDVRLRAMEEVLRRAKFTAEDVVFIQVAVPSREDVAEYVEMRSSIEELVGRINGQHSETGRVAIHYLRRNLAQEELFAYYTLAEVMLVTPLRDGMNLVAKEYPACRLKNDGVLVLSEFAGASDELRQAVTVNPFDIDGVAYSIETALRMGKAEQKRRMTAMRRYLRAHDVYDWADSFLGALKK